jgi:pectate lyase
MQVTIAYNHFGEGLIQRMPRCRHGYFHVVNNDYTHWEMYAIGGSADPTINSQGNRYNAPTNPFAKEVTKRVETPEGQWKGWNWRSEGDLYLNGAYFTASGAGASASYARASSLGAKSSAMVGTITSNAGALGCKRGRQC